MARRLLLDEPALLLLPSLAVVLGTNEALILQQFNYWLRASKNEWEGYFWTYNSYSDWQKQFPFMSKETLARAIRKLEKMGLIVSKVGPNRKSFDRTKWYRLDYDRFEDMFPDERDNMTRRRQQIDPSIVPECSDEDVILTQHNEASHDDKLTSTIPDKTSSEINNKEVSSSKKKTQPLKLHTRPIFAEMQKEFGYPEKTDKDPIPNYGKEAKAIDRMGKRGYTEADILAAWQTKVRARGEFVSMVYVNEDIGKPDKPRQAAFRLPDEEKLAAAAREKGFIKK